MNDKESREFLRDALLVNFLEIKAINISDLTSDMSDQRNAIYRVPLSKPSEEERAQVMADASYSIVLGRHSKEPDFDHDVAFEQCLIDARRLLLDPNFDHLINLSTFFHLIDHAPAEIILPAFPDLTAEQKANLFQQT
jgi:hypothetical protein